MALPDIPADLLEEEMAVGIYEIDSSIKETNRKLDSIADTLVEIFVVNDDTMKKLQQMFNLESERRQEEKLSEGLDLEKERESVKEGGGVTEKINKKFEDAANNTSLLGSAALFAAGLLTTFSSDVRDFLGKFGASASELDNIITGLAATRFAIPKSAPSKIPTTPPSAKSTAKFGPRASATATPSTAALRNIGQDNLKSSKITSSGKTIKGAVAEGIKKGAAASAQAADNVTGSVLKGTTKVLGKVATPIAVAVEGANIYKTATDDSLTEAEKKIKYSESAGGIGGALAGAKIGAAGYALGPVVGTITTVVGGIAGSILGEELGGWLGKIGFGDEKTEEMKDKLSGIDDKKMFDAEDRVMNQGPIRAASETQMFGMSAQGFSAAAKSRAAIVNEGMKKIDDVKPSISGDNINVTVRVDRASKETTESSKITPIIKQGDTVNNITNINGGGGSSAGRSVPNSAKQSRTPGGSGSTELTDFVNGNF